MALCHVLRHGKLLSQRTSGVVDFDVFRDLCNSKSSKLASSGDFNDLWLPAKQVTFEEAVGAGVPCGVL
jgi:hypothetical protein